MKFLILNGPNINMLGIREPEIYGRQSYEDLVNLIKKHAAEIGVEVEFYQSNHEGDLVDAIQKAYFDHIDGIVFNPAAYTHTSVAIADAVKGVGIPTVEVHISEVSKKAGVLIEAISYIKRFKGSVFVVKYGGAFMDDPDPKIRASVANDIAFLAAVGIRTVVVHGGGPEISEMLKKTGKESRFVDGLRYTDEETMDVVQSVLCGKVNKNLVAQLNRLGGQAIGLCGMDGAMFQAEQLDAKYGLVGRITGVNPEPVENALMTGYIPVVSTVAQGVDADTAYNINADTAAAKLAEALGAEKLILLTDVRGLLRDPKDEETLIHVLHTYDVPALIAQGIISGGMIPKIECSVEAINGGVERVHILDGRIPHSILIELLSNEGIGTMLVN